MNKDKRMIPYPYQEDDIQALVRAGGSGLVVSEVGGGKTLVAVETALRVQAKTVLIIAPQGTHGMLGPSTPGSGWRGTIHAQTGIDQLKKVDSSVRGKSNLVELKWGEPGWYICTPQWFARQQWKAYKPDMAVFDEIHVAGAYGNVTRKKLHQLVAKSRIGLSGTPLRNKIENAWSIVRWIFPECMPRPYWEWRIMELATVYDRFAPQNRRVTGERVPGTIVNSLPCYIQHLQREQCCIHHPNGFIADLKEPEVIIRTVEMTPKQKRFYKQMEKDYVAWLTTPDDQGNLPVVAELPIVARGMLRFAAFGLPSLDTETNKLYFEDDCESPKVEEVLQVLSEMGDKSALILTHSKQAARVLVRRLEAAGISSFEWSSASTQKKREVAKAQFINGELRTIVAVISAIGTGTDGLQLATSTEIWVSEDDDQTNNQQGKGRTDRPGQTNQVVRIYIQAAETFDQGIMSKNLETALKMSAALRKKVA